MNFRRLLCYIGWHRQGDPIELGGYSYETVCKDCGLKTLNIRVSFEDKGE